jgi:hypothetical protein
MDNNASPKADKTPKTSPEAPFTTFIQLDGSPPFHRSFVPGLNRKRSPVLSPTCWRVPACKDVA